MNEQAHSGWSSLKPRSTDPLSGELSINWEYMGRDGACVLGVVYLIVATLVWLFVEISEVQVDTVLQLVQ